MTKDEALYIARAVETALWPLVQSTAVLYGDESHDTKLAKRLRRQAVEAVEDASTAMLWKQGGEADVELLEQAGRLLPVVTVEKPETR